MRPLAEPAATVVAAATAEYVIHLSPPLSSPTPRCEPHACSSNSRDFEANAATVLIVLLCALICALFLNTAIRCFLRGGANNEPPPQHHDHERKSTLEKGVADTLVAAPTVVFSAGLKLGGTEAECAICLSEFVEGEGIRVLGRCNHGFHVQCIEQWLFSHNSCPTCRCSCLPPSPEEGPTLSSSTQQTSHLYAAS